MINEEKAGMEFIYSMDSRTSCSPFKFHYPTNNTASKCCHITVHTVTQSSPSPVISCVEDVPQGARVSHITVTDSEHGHSTSSNESTTSKVLQDVHISTRLMEDFLELAKDNTDNDLETCGILGAFLEKGTFYATTLIIPKQESTSGSCQAINEEEVFAIQNEHSLYPVGWIHAMLPEAFAIVMAPTDTSRLAPESLVVNFVPAKKKNIAVICEHIFFA
ncbi:hypothetical protein RGQ29_015541 [Quercus rubra]|uniref:JAB1/MPN/MOV34 metalloenzyme domain-containing protein n=1 Tax=Quercus rubra TaxID=3512 RepID=A0AAN7J4I5_QUERU|nr:hypothetical protein RGQ29_015541 [Quercus rubra]